MKKLTVILLLFVFTCTTVLAGDNVNMLKKDAPAPYTGLLVKEARFTELIQAELDAADLRGRMKIKEGEHKAVQNIMEKSLLEATKPDPWYKTGTFNFWVGFTLGLTATALAVYGAAKLGESFR